MPSSRSSANSVSSTSAERVPLARLRGCTRPGRLARIDAVIVRREHALLTRCDGAFATAPCVDVGVGEWPWTTLELLRTVTLAAPELRVIGVEIDPDRLRHARRFAEPGLEFRRGGFELPLAANERPRLVRALNVLREYGECEAEAAQLTLSAALLPGGLLVEGTSSASGGVACVHLLRKRPDGGLAREGLIFSTDFSQGFAPWLFRDRLPRDLRRQCKPGHAIHAFLTAWTDAFRVVRSAGLRDAATMFTESALLLAASQPGIADDPALITQGTLVWQPPGGTPAALWG